MPWGRLLFCSSAEWVNAILEGFLESAVGDMEGGPVSGFTALVNELRNANRNDFCLSEAGLLVAASGVHGSGHVCHPEAVVQPSAGVRGSLCLQKEEGLQLERTSCSEGRVELPLLLLSLGWGSILEEQPGWLGCDTEMSSGPKD